MPVLATSFVTVLGWTAACVSLFISTPQLIRMLRQHTIAGVSQTAWQITFGMNITWMAYGLMHHNPNQWVPNVWLLTATLLILNMFHKHLGTPWWRLTGPGIAIASVSTLLGITLGSVAFAVAVFIPAAVSLVSQLRSTLTSIDVAGISMFYLGLGVTNQTLWIVWALLAHDQSVVMVGAAALVLMVTNLVAAALRTSGRLAAIGQPEPAFARVSAE